MKRVVQAVGRALRWLAVVVVVLGVPTGVGLAWAYQRYVVDDPGPEFTRDAILGIIAQESPVYYRDGATRIGVFFDVEHRAWVPWNDIPEDWVHAIVASEDGAFFEHPGVSAKHIVRAAIQNVRAGRVVAGGSTLTQQTAKNLFYRPDRSVRSKLVELVDALRLEAHFSKEEILEFYANQFHVSANGRGLGIGARYFFDKAPRELTLKECAFLAGLVKAPSRYNPFLGESEERRAAARAAAEDRTAYVLRRMVEEGYVPARELPALLAEPLVFRRGAFQYDRSVIMDEVQRELEEPTFIELFERLGISNPSTAGIQIVTGIDPAAQIGAQYALWHHLSEIGPVLERAPAKAWRLPDDTPVPVAPGQALVPRSFQPARVERWDADGLRLDVGGRVCTVDAAGLQRVADIVARARVGSLSARATSADVAAVEAALPVGAIVTASVREARGRGLDRCDVELRPELQGAVLVLEDGMVRALVGGNDNRNFDRALSARRQFGSTWKPVVYAAALHLGWEPTDILDNRRSVFPFRGTFYTPRADHASDPWVTMSLAGARSENLASVWLLARLVDHLNPEQLRRLAELVGLAARPDETASGWVARLRDEEGLRSTPEMLERRAFTLAKDDVLGGIAFSAHPSDAAAVRSLQHGHGFAAERARLLRASADDRAARLELLDLNLLDLEEAVRACAPDASFCGRPPWTAAPEPADPSAVAPPPAVPEPAVEPAVVPLDDRLVHGVLHVATLKALRAAVDARVTELQGRDPWDPELLALDPDFRQLVGTRYVERLAAAFGVAEDLPTTLALPLGVADVTLGEMSAIYQGFLSGARYTIDGRGFREGSVPGTRATFELPAPGVGPGLIAEIRDARGNVIYRASTRAEAVADPTAGALVGDILRNVVRVGTGRRARGAVTVAGAPIPLAGKTGTTNDWRNAAFLGFAPRTTTGPPRWGDAYTVGVYVGYDDNRAMRRGAVRIQGANGALPVWLGTVERMAEAGLCGRAGFDEWLPPEGATRAPVLDGTGLPREGAPDDGPTTLRVEGRRFVPFAEPAAAAAGTSASPLPPATPPVDAEPGQREEGLEDTPPDAAPTSEPSIWDEL